MSLLGSIPSNLGRISLHHTNEGFETRRRWLDVISGEERVCIVTMSRHDAIFWYGLCEERGMCKVAQARKAFGWKRRR